jgi:hypothetical protein
VRVCDSVYVGVGVWIVMCDSVCSCDSVCACDSVCGSRAIV